MRQPRYITWYRTYCFNTHLANPGHLVSQTRNRVICGGGRFVQGSRSFKGKTGIFASSPRFLQCVKVSVSHYQPTTTHVLEIDLDPGMLALAFVLQHNTFAEFCVVHALPQ